MNDQDESPWIDYGEALLRARRLLLVGILTCWTVVLLAHFLVPRQYACEATLSFPPVIPKVKDEEAQRVGIPLALYRKLANLLSSEQILSNGMKTVLAAPEIKSLEMTFSQRVVPVTTSASGDVKRMTSDDTIIGVQLTYEAGSSEQAKKVVTSLAKLCRNAFLNLLVIQHVEFESAAANRRRVDALQKRARLAYVGESLKTQADDARRLVAEFPTVPPSVGQQVVDARGEGGWFLSPTIQAVAVKAHQAETARDLRVLDRQIHMEATRLAFLRQLDERIYGLGIQSEAQLQSDVVGLIREELHRFTSTRLAAEDVTGTALLTAEVDALAELIGGASETTRFLQLPTARREPRATRTLVFLVLTASLVILLALARDSWTRSHSH